jgi:sialic acid synthase SpsE
MIIAGRHIGVDHAPFTIAELGLNHAGSLACAIDMVEAAHRAGASCVKLQTHCDDEFSDVPAYPGNAGGESIQDFVRRCSLFEADERAVFDYARDIGIICISTPFSPMAVERLERAGVPAYKIGSGQVHDERVLRAVANTTKPVIMSTGMSTMGDVARAADHFRAVDVALLHCTSQYPTQFPDVRLGALEQLHDIEDCYGLSDHTGTIWPSLGAVALGASILEVHFKHNCPPGPDLCVSVDERQLADLVTGARAIWECRGGEKTVLPGEAATLAWFAASRRKT